MSAECDQLVAQSDRFQAKPHRVDDQVAGNGRMQEEPAALEVVAVSPDRAVTVVAGPSGAIMGRCGRPSPRPPAARPGSWRTRSATTCT